MKKANKKLSGILSILLILAVLASGFAMMGCTTYTVTFNPDGGSVSPSSISVSSGGKYGTFPTPTKTGYTFGGWFTARNGGGSRIQAGMDVAIKGDHTLYAKWTAAAHKHTFTVSGFKSEAPKGTAYELANGITAGSQIWNYGTIKSTCGHNLEFAEVVVVRVSDGVWMCSANATINSKEYPLETLDNKNSMTFRTLAPGDYRYAVRVKIGGEYLAMTVKHFSVKTATFAWPMANVTRSNINAIGKFKSPEYKATYGGNHLGLDIPFGNRTVLSAGSGTVVYSEWSDVLGWNVTIKHDNGWYTCYFHLAYKCSVAVGTRVVAGTPIGTSGDTGTASDGAHLHFELIRPVAGQLCQGGRRGEGGNYIYGEQVDPLLYLP